MSRNINVNPAHYKVAGRERQGENLVQSVERQAYAQQKAEADRWHAKEAPSAWETTPPAPPVTQEDRDEAAAIAEVQRPKTRAAKSKSKTSKKRGKTAVKPGATRKTASARSKSASRTAKPGRRGARKTVRRKAR